MQDLISAVEQKYRKKHIPVVKSGDTVRISQRIDEGDKTRTQVFEGLVIRTRRSNSITNSITVRRVASNVGVEKTFMLHHPSIEDVEIVRRSRVRRNYLTYMRKRTGKSARLNAVAFDRDAVNTKEPEEQPASDEPVKAKDVDQTPEAKETDTKTDKNDKKTSTESSKSENSDKSKDESKAKK